MLLAIGAPRSLIVEWPQFQSDQLKPA